MVLRGRDLGSSAFVGGAATAADPARIAIAKTGASFTRHLLHRRRPPTQSGGPAPSPGRQIPRGWPIVPTGPLGGLSILVIAFW